MRMRFPLLWRGIPESLICARPDSIVVAEGLVGLGTIGGMQGWGGTVDLVRKASRRSLQTLTRDGGVNDYLGELS